MQANLGVRAARVRGVASLVVCLALGVFGGAASAGQNAPTHWAAAHIDTVVRAGLLAPDAATFRPDDRLTRGELHGALVALGHARPEPADPLRPVTIRELDAQLVTAAGAMPIASTFRRQAAAAGLEPTAMLGTETVARLLGLRFNHPRSAETRELAPHEPATRAEAAYSFARLLSLDKGRVPALALQVQSTFSPPPLDTLQTALLTTALRFVGYPYVFAGASEKPQRLWSSGGTVPAPPGFDCSGFVLRVIKLQQYPTAPALAGVLRGRTSYDLSGEVPAASRYPLARLAPGDVLFFGSAGPRSTPQQIGHMGLYVGNGWFVHSSDNGVTLQPMTGWYATSFAWARRPLAEAGVS